MSRYIYLFFAKPVACRNISGELNKQNQVTARDLRLGRGKVWGNLDMPRISSLVRTTMFAPLFPLLRFLSDFVPLLCSFRNTQLYCWYVPCSFSLLYRLTMLVLSIVLIFLVMRLVGISLSHIHYIHSLYLPTVRICRTGVVVLPQGRVI